ncbi:putative adhesin [Lentzea sp. E54]|uniref:putative adhesin n=1 Tax=Lentzea xerophila TaxID=3435883 RepID=UPI003DA3119F
MTGRRVFVMGHGSSDPAVRIVVPRGLLVHFYADEGHFLTGTVALAAMVTSGQYGSSWSVASAMDGPLATCSNVLLGRLADAEHATVLAALPAGTDAVLVGDERYPLDGKSLPLCRTPDECADQGVHRCGGWFDHFASERELHVVCCLGRNEQTAAPSTRLTAEEASAGLTRAESLDGQLITSAFRFLGLPPDEQDTQWRAWPEGVRATLITANKHVHAWWVRRSARDVLEREGRFALYSYWRGQPPLDQKLIRADAVLMAQLESAHHWEAGWATGTMLPENASAELAKLDERDRSALSTSRPSLHRWLTRWAAMLPQGMTGSALLTAVAGCTAERLREVREPVILDCAVHEDLVVVDPQRLVVIADPFGFEQGPEGPLSRAISAWQVVPRGVTVSAAPDGVPVLTPHGPLDGHACWARLVDAGVARLRRPVEVLVLDGTSTVHDQFVLGEHNAVLRQALDLVNQVVLRGQHDPSSLATAVAHARQALAARAEQVRRAAGFDFAGCVEVLGSWSGGTGQPTTELEVLWELAHVVESTDLLGEVNALAATVTAAVDAEHAGEISETLRAAVRDQADVLVQRLLTLSRWLQRAHDDNDTIEYQLTMTAASAVSQW